MLINKKREEERKILHIYFVNFLNTADVNINKIFVFC